MTTATRTNSTLACDACGEEMQVIDALDDDFDFTEATEQWNRDHARCVQSAELATWLDLVDRGDQSIAWKVNDLEDVARVPRPSWAPFGRDSIRTSLWASSFRSSPVAVTLDHCNAAADGLRARFEVSAKRTALGDNQIAITLHKVVDGDWTFLGTNMTLDEARMLSEVLAAAVALAVRA